MKSRKRAFVFILIVVCVSFSFVACLPEKQSTETSNTIIEKENLTDLILKNGELVPGESLSWYMSVDDFLNGNYGSPVLNPDSEKFQEYRRGEMPNGMISYNPPVIVDFNEYNMQAETTFVFDENGQLIQSLHRFISADSDIDAYMVLLNTLIEEADAIQILEPDQSQECDFTEQDILDDHIALKWNNNSDACYFRISSAHFQDTLILDLVLSVDSY